MAEYMIKTQQDEHEKAAYYLVMQTAHGMHDWLVLAVGVLHAADDNAVV
jgi:hypothetical protein